MIINNFCPECLRRRERLFAGTPLYSKFKAGRLVNGQCGRCLYNQPISLADTSQFVLPPKLATDVEAAYPETHDSAAAAS